MVKEVFEKYIELLEKEISDVSEIETLLTGVEKTILNVLKKKKRAMNVNEIRNTIIDDFMNLMKYYVRSRDRLKPVGLDYYSDKPVLQFWDGDYNDIPDLFISIYNELKDMGILKNYNVLERDKKKVASLLKKYGIANIPTNSTIERVLREFEASGLVISRSDTGGKGKKLYALNPKILRFLG
ncbi:hypothetical protein DRO97_01370 [Archaeoglobales archaeon]|nr:MAG: hypothetical protein DRO97_01370 [Archaeoglobales archaeon]